MRPSPASRSARLPACILKRWRRMSTAFSMSPPASVRADLHSIIGRLVRSRSVLTAVAEIVDIVTLRPQSVLIESDVARPPFVATDHGQRTTDGRLFNDGGGRLR